MFFIGESSQNARRGRPNREESRGRERVKITILKPQRPSARGDSMPSLRSDSSEEDWNKPLPRPLRPSVQKAAATATVKTKTATKASSSSRRNPPDPGSDDDGPGRGDGDDEDKHEKRKKHDKDKDRDRKPPRIPPKGGDYGDGDGDDGGDSSDNGAHGPGGSSSSDSSDDSADRLLRKLRRRRNGKEADKIILPSISNAAAFRAWRVTARTNVVAASGKGERAFLWVMEVENPEVSFKRLYNTGSRFADLDAKLLSAVTDKAH
jgi:hypothetical protein